MTFYRFSVTNEDDYNCEYIIQRYSKTGVFVCAYVKAVGNAEKKPVQVEIVLLIIG